MTVENAHVKNTETGSLLFSVDDKTILSRGGDDTVKCRSSLSSYDWSLTSFAVWDLRSIRKPLAVRSNVTTLYPTTNAVFSPDEKFVVTGCGASEKGGRGRLLFLRRENLDIEREIEMDANPVRVVWHPKINQVCIVICLTDYQV